MRSESCSRLFHSKDCVIGEMVIPPMNHVLCLLYERSGSKFSPRLINSTVIIISSKAVSPSIRSATIRAALTMRKPKIDERACCWRPLKLFYSPAESTSAVSESLLHSSEKENAKQLFMKTHFQWRPLTLLPSFDSTTFRNIFRTSRSAKNKLKQNHK